MSTKFDVSMGLTYGRIVDLGARHYARMVELHIHTHANIRRMSTPYMHIYAYAYSSIYKYIFCLILVCAYASLQVYISAYIPFIYQGYTHACINAYTLQHPNCLWKRFIVRSSKCENYSRSNMKCHKFRRIH